MRLEHVPNPEDAAVWTTKTPIIGLTTVEMHHSDCVKLQFGMHQEIPCPPMCLDPWHLKKPPVVSKELEGLRPGVP